MNKHARLSQLLGFYKIHRVGQNSPNLILLFAVKVAASAWTHSARKLCSQDAFAARCSQL